MSRLLEFTDDVREVRGFHRGPVTVVNLSATDRLWVDDDPSVAPGQGLPVEPSGVTVFESASGHVYYVRDSTHQSTGNPRAVLTRGAGAYNNPAANRPPVAGVGMTFVGILNTNTSQVYDISPYRSLRIYIKNTGPGGGDIGISFSNKTGGGAFGLSLGGVGIGGNVGAAGAKATTGGVVILPTLGDTISVSGYASTSAEIYGSPDQVEGMTGFPDSREAVVSQTMPAGGNQSVQIGSVFGPCRCDWAAWIADTSTDGYFALGHQGGNNVSFADTKAFTQTARGLNGHGSFTTAPGLESIVFYQSAATTGGEVILNVNLSPLNS